MKYHFFEKKVDISEELREYAQKKIGKLEKFFKVESDASVSFIREGNRHITEITVANDGVIFRARENSDDMYAGIDSGVSAIERQIRKNKTRLEKRLRHGAFEREIPVTTPDSAIEEDTDFTIIREKRFDLKPMTPEEAILQMNLLGHQFFMFKNFARNAAIAVVYRRESGGYGLIEGK
ncbi:MAG: ribosome-associated translation inhibitor RaiA [Oscillospiraceae bacterium]|jgi:putative sigma-54 modulation protein|nr:ribosome-associated translation inhibitor RaiA [Oscillospiraceae bacterium]